MENTQVSRLRKNWIVCFQPMKFEKSEQSKRPRQLYKPVRHLRNAWARRDKMKYSWLNKGTIMNSHPASLRSFV